MKDIKLKIEIEVLYLIDKLLEQIFNPGTPFTELEKVRKSIALDLVDIFEKKRKSAQKYRNATKQ